MSAGNYQLARHGHCENLNDVSCIESTEQFAAADAGRALLFQSVPHKRGAAALSVRNAKTMNDMKRMKGLKMRYFELVQSHGDAISELKAFQKSLRDLNKQHRLNAIRMYEEMILKIETNVGRSEKSQSGRRE